MHTLLFSKVGSVLALPAIFRPLYFLEGRGQKGTTQIRIEPQLLQEFEALGLLFLR